jgi:hypothetical protein
VSSRERRRAELRKRKARRGPVPAEASVGAQSPSGEVPIRPEPPPLSRSAVRDEAAREALEPLHDGERPRVVTVAAVISASIALSVLGAYIAGATVDGARPHAAQVFAPALLMGWMAYGLWSARYWAVLGFQVVLLFLILGSAAGLIQAVNLAQVAGRGFIFAGSGLLFWFMVKAMARIQMPERRPRE